MVDEDKPASTSVLRHRKREYDRYWSNPDESRRKRRLGYHRRKAEQSGTEPHPNAGMGPPDGYADSIELLGSLVNMAAKAREESHDPHSGD